MKSIYQKTAVLILAGGQSQRAETVKGLRQINQDYWIDVQINFFKNLGLNKIFVGLGYNYQEYTAQSKSIRNCYYEINPFPENGSFSTLQCTLKIALEEDWDNTLLIHIDHALPRVLTINKLLQDSIHDVIKPVCNSKSGHPIVLSRYFCNTLLSKPYSSQLNIEIQNLNLDKISWILVDDNNIHHNLNTKDNWLDYKRSIKKS